MPPKFCPKCNKSFQTNEHLTSHLNRKNPCDAPRSFACTCGSRFIYSSSLSRHKKSCSRKAEKQDVDSKNAAKKNQPINSFDGLTAVILSIDMVIKLFEIQTFKDLTQMQYNVRAKGVTEELSTQFFVKLIYEAHTSPAQRNVYLNPARADQVCAYQTGEWKCMELIDAIRVLFESVSEQLRQIVDMQTHSKEIRKELSVDIADSIGHINRVYREYKNKIVMNAKRRIEAHLSNMRPKPPMPGKLPAPVPIPPKLKTFDAKTTYARMLKHHGGPLPREPEQPGLPPAPRDEGPDLKTVVEEVIPMFKTAKDVNLGMTKHFVCAVAIAMGMSDPSYDLVSSVTNKLLEIEDPRAGALYNILNTGVIEDDLYAFEVEDAKEKNLPIPPMPEPVAYSAAVMKCIPPISNPKTITLKECQTLMAVLAKRLGVKEVTVQFVQKVGYHIWRRFPELKSTKMYDILNPGGSLVRALMAEIADKEDQDDYDADLAECGESIRKYRESLGLIRKPAVPLTAAGLQQTPTAPLTAAGLPVIAPASSPAQTASLSAKSPTDK